MPISATRKAAIRAEIVEHAARLFRLRGHAGTNIDDIMLAAGLTRGAFYAHFTSKDDLFAEIVRMGHGLLPKLRAAETLDSVLDDYLDREALTATAQGCALASLAGDVARSPLAARRLCQRAAWRDCGDGPRKEAHAGRRRDRRGDPGGRRRHAGARLGRHTAQRLAAALRPAHGQGPDEAQAESETQAEEIA